MYSVGSEKCVWKYIFKFSIFNYFSWIFLCKILDNSKAKLLVYQIIFHRIITDMHMNVSQDRIN